MGFPSTPDTRIRSRNDAASVALLLKERHDGHFMVWNLAEESYDYALFDNQVRGEARVRKHLRRWGSAATGAGAGSLGEGGGAASSPDVPTYGCCCCSCELSTQVIECRFPGFPSPPLGLLFKICSSIENWLLADPANVAVIHCAWRRGQRASQPSALRASASVIAPPRPAPLPQA